MRMPGVLGVLGLLFCFRSAASDGGTAECNVSQLSALPYLSTPTNVARWLRRHGPSCAHALLARPASGILGQGPWAGALGRGLGGSPGLAPARNSLERDPVTQACSERRPWLVSMSGGCSERRRAKSRPRPRARTPVRSVRTGVMRCQTAAKQRARAPVLTCATAASSLVRSVARQPPAAGTGLWVGTGPTAWSPPSWPQSGRPGEMTPTPSVSFPMLPSTGTVAPWRRCGAATTSPRRRWSCSVRRRARARGAVVLSPTSSQLTWASSTARTSDRRPLTVSTTRRVAPPKPGPAPPHSSKVGTRPTPAHRALVCRHFHLTPSLAGENNACVGHAMALEAFAAAARSMELARAGETSHYHNVESALRWMANSAPSGSGCHTRRSRHEGPASSAPHAPLRACSVIAMV